MRSLAIVERRHLKAVVTKQCIAQNKELVGLLAATRDEASLIGGALVVGALNNVERRRAGLYPYKTPVIIKVIRKAFARFEGRVLVRTLRLKGVRSQQ